MPKRTSGKIQNRITISIATLPNIEPIIRGTVLHWFIKAAQSILGIGSMLSYTVFDSIEYAVKDVHTEELRKAHLPEPIVTLSDAIDILRRCASGAKPRCGKDAKISGGIPPKLTAEIAEYVRIFGGSGREKREIFELCEDAVALAEIGAFLSFCGIRKPREKSREGRPEYHYVLVEALREIPDTYKRIKYAKDLKTTMSILVKNEAPLNTIIVGASACIAKYIRSIPRRSRSNIILEYLRLERGNVLNIAGFNVLPLTEVIEFIKKSKITSPLYILIRNYPSEADVNKIQELKKLRNAINDLTRDIVLFLSNINKLIPTLKGFRPVREPIYLYRIVRNLRTFLDSLDKQSEKILNNYLRLEHLDVRSIIERIIRGIEAVIVEKGNWR